MGNLTQGTKLNKDRVGPYLDSYKGQIVPRTFSDGTDIDHMQSL